MREEWPLAGRDAELRRLYDLVTDGRRRGVVLAGAAGVGKTRLANECLALAQQAGMATVAVRATRAGASVPFGALATVLPAISHAEAGAVDDRADLIRRAAAAVLERA